MIPIRFCKNCTYYLKDNIIEHSLCLKYAKEKWFIFEKAEDVRKDRNKCGPEGFNFIKK
jgi:hypothetical protein